MPASTSPAAASASRSCGEPLRVFGSAATIISSDAPIADEGAAAEPPPGVGSGELNAASRSRTARSRSMDDASLLDDGADRLGADTDQIDRRAVDDDGVHLPAGFEAADAIVTIERVGGVDRRA